MKMNENFLSLPPYITTAWNNVKALFVEEDDAGTSFLVIELKNGKTPIRIPDLPKSTIDKAFQYHTQSLEEEVTPNSPLPPFRIGSIGLGSLDQLGATMQHDPAQMHAPDLPKDFLDKVIQIAKALGIDHPDHLPKPEPHCNCPHCQVARVLQNPDEQDVEEEVSDEDLTFRTWDIEQIGDQLYSVINPLDTSEKYTVFLGDPIGCTCGQKNCEHIKAVLNS